MQVHNEPDPTNAQAPQLLDAICLWPVTNGHEVHALHKKCIMTRRALTAVLITPGVDHDDDEDDDKDCEHESESNRECNNFSNDESASSKSSAANSQDAREILHEESLIAGVRRDTDPVQEDLEEESEEE